MPNITTCLWFDRQAEEAAQFYVKVFAEGGRSAKLGKIARYGESGAKASGQEKGTVMTVDFELDGNKFMGLNGGPIPLLDYCRTKCGVILGVGIGQFSGRAFRIAHMGHVNAPMGALGAIEMGLAALRIPHAVGGVQRAVEYLGREVAA